VVLGCSTVESTVMDAPGEPLVVAELEACAKELNAPVISKTSVVARTNLTILVICTPVALQYVFPEDHPFRCLRRSYRSIIIISQCFKIVNDKMELSRGIRIGGLGKRL
jgi:hypothetical protein